MSTSAGSGAGMGGLRDRAVPDLVLSDVPAAPSSTGGAAGTHAYSTSSAAQAAHQQPRANPPSHRSQPNPSTPIPVSPATASVGTARKDHTRVKEAVRSYLMSCGGQWKHYKEIWASIPEPIRESFHPELAKHPSRRFQYFQNTINSWKARETTIRRASGGFYAFATAGVGAIQVATAPTPRISSYSPPDLAGTIEWPGDPSGFVAGSPRTGTLQDAYARRDYHFRADSGYCAPSPDIKGVHAPEGRYVADIAQWQAARANPQTEIGVSANVGQQNLNANAATATKLSTSWSWPQPSFVPPPPGPQDTRDGFWNIPVVSPAFAFSDRPPSSAIASQLPRARLPSLTELFAVQPGAKGLFPTADFLQPDGGGGNASPDGTDVSPYIADSRVSPTVAAAYGRSPAVSAGGATPIYESLTATPVSAQLQMAASPTTGSLMVSSFPMSRTLSAPPAPVGLGAAFSATALPVGEAAGYVISSPRAAVFASASSAGLAGARFVDASASAAAVERVREIDERIGSLEAEIGLLRAERRRLVGGM